jgi:hypothetical protein
MKLRYRVAFGVIYTLVYLFLTVNVIGLEGRGPLLFAAPLRPFGLPWIFLLIAIYQTRNLGNNGSVIGFLLLMAGHYAITTYYLIPDLRFDASPEGEALSRIMRIRPVDVYYAFVWYAAGQIIIWLLFVVGIRNHSKSN